jgi:hypothetical protein
MNESVPDKRKQMQTRISALLGPSSDFDDACRCILEPFAFPTATSSHLSHGVVSGTDDSIRRCHASLTQTDEQSSSLQDVQRADENRPLHSLLPGASLLPLPSTAVPFGQHHDPSARDRASAEGVSLSKDDNIVSKRRKL